MSESESAPVLYGRRLLPTFIDERARVKHSKPYASIPRTAKAEDGFRDVSYRAFANAINRCARWLQSHVGRSTDFEPVIYLGPSDLRYQILCMAAVKSGHVMFFVSPRNSLDAHLHLIRESSVTKLITPSSAFPIVSQIEQKVPLERFTIPTLDEILDETPVAHVSFDKTFDEYRMRPWLLLHTSGSTGLPKVICLRHGYASAPDAFNLLTVNEAALSMGGKRVFNANPPFHMAGIVPSLAVTVWYDCTLVLPPPVMMNADVVNSVHIHGNVEYSTLPPAIVVDLVKNEEYLEALKKLDGLRYAGGPLPQATGDFLSEILPLGNSIGATETYTPFFLPKDREDWAYFAFNLAHGGVEFRAHESGHFEMVWVREPAIELAQAVFVTFPELDEYHTKDLFSKHPTKKGLWKYEGRLDDVIVFNNGEKFNPVTMEGTITSCPEVSGCLVVGQGQFQAALIVEAKQPPLSKGDERELLNKLWPFVERANKVAVKQGRIARDAVAFTKGDKPLSRAAKGTVQRAPNNRLFKEEIDRLYERLEAGGGSSDAKLDLSTVEAAEASIQNFMQTSLGTGDIDVDDDFFSRGLDSLQLITLLRAINSSSTRSRAQLKQIYDHPSIARLARSLVSYEDEVPVDSDEDEETWVKMQAVYEKAAQDLPGQTARSKTWLGRRRRKAMFVPPNKGRVAWLQVLASFLINFNNWGLLNSFGVYQSYYERTLLPYKSSSEIAWIGTLQGALLLIVGVISGPLFDKGYFRILLAASGLCLVFALMMLSLATQYYQIMLAQGLLTGLCMGMLYIPSIALMSMYFTTKRGLALGLATSGGSVGGIIFPIVFRRLLDELGFGWANRIIAFLILTTLTISVAIVRPTSGIKRPSRNLIDRTALHELPFLTFAIAGFLIYAAVLVPFFLAPTFASQNLHASDNLSFYLVAILNTGQFFGRIVPGFVSDYSSTSSYAAPEALLFGAEALTALLAFSWIAVKSVAGFELWLLVYGFASGAVSTLSAAVLPYICPSLPIMGTRLGMVWGVAGVGVLISTPVATATGGFLGAQLWMGVCCAVGLGFYCVTAVEARRRRLVVDAPKRRREMAEKEKRRIGKGTPVQKERGMSSWGKKKVGLGEFAERASAVQWFKRGRGQGEVAEKKKSDMGRVDSGITVYVGT